MIKEEKYLDRYTKIRGKFSNIIKQISDSELMYNKKLKEKFITTYDFKRKFSLILYTSILIDLVYRKYENF